MQKEIGGYIEFEHYSGKQLHESAIKLNCARNCLAYLFKSCDVQKIYIPYFLCDSVLKTCKKYGIKLQFYHIDENFMPIIPSGDFSKDWLYVVNYYGQLSNETILKIKSKVQNLIIDNVQAFFQPPVSNVHTIYTCRKFFGVSDGAYLYTDSKLDEVLERDISYKRMNFLFGRFEKSAYEFYQEYVANNDLFENEPIKQMSSLTENLMCSFDYSAVAQRRTENFNYLYESLNSMNKLNLKVPYGAFSYPLLIENGASMRKKLQQRNIYIPTLWSDVFKLCESTSLEYQYAQNILPLPVDQRYGRVEIEYMLQQLNK